MRVAVESPHPPDQCGRLLEASFGGRMRFRWLTVSRGTQFDRVVGRIDGGGVAATLIHGTTAPVSLGRFGRQLVSARIRPDGSGSTITGSIRYPYFDRALYSAILGFVGALLTLNPLFVAAAPVFFAAFWAYENLLAPERLRMDAKVLLSGLTAAVDGRPLPE